ncbi:MAG: hypothetical protein JSR83_12800 [Proteobacteria bacterium]|nr:hypothetical protein [Pseudomonadota bacterium]
MLPRYKQAEITSGYSDRYLATTVGHNWAYTPERGFQRLPTSQLRHAFDQREDL